MTGGGGAGSATVIVAGRDVVSAMVKCRLLIIVLAGVVSNPRRACSIAANISGGTWRNEALGLLSVSSATSAGGMYGPALRTRLCVRTTIIIAAAPNEIPFRSAAVKATMSRKSDVAATSAPAKYQRIPARRNRTTAISAPFRRC